MVLKATRDKATGSFCIARLHSVQAVKPEAAGKHVQKGAAVPW